MYADGSVLISSGQVSRNFMICRNTFKEMRKKIKYRATYRFFKTTAIYVQCSALYLWSTRNAQSKALTSCSYSISVNCPCMDRLLHTGRWWHSPLFAPFQECAADHWSDSLKGIENHKVNKVLTRGRSGHQEKGCWCILISCPVRLVVQ